MPFTNPKDAVTFMLAGCAIITAESQRTGKHFTYKVRQAADQPNQGPIWFCSVLTGPSNEADYAYFGLIKTDQEGRCFFRPARPEKARVPADAPSAKAFAWMMHSLLLKGEMPPETTLSHSGHCGRCGRRLTTPESLAKGFGPECVHLVAEAA